MATSDFNLALEISLYSIHFTSSNGISGRSLVGSTAINSFIISSALQSKICVLPTAIAHTKSSFVVINLCSIKILFSSQHKTYTKKTVYIEAYFREETAADLGFDSEEAEELEESAVSYGASAHGDTTAISSERRVQSSSLVQIDSSKIQFSYESRVVHVIHEGVYVVRQTYS